MLVRIQLSSKTKVRAKRRKNQHVALALAALLTPAAVMACVLAFWRLGADLNVTGQFPIPFGLFSHWQVWLTLAASLQFSATLLNRYGLTEQAIPEAPVSLEDESERELADSRY